MPTKIEFKVSYNGGMATNGSLHIYDASESLRGLSRALAITTHAFLNEGEVRTRASTVQGAEIYLHAPQRGSFLEAVSIVFTDPVAQAIGLSVISSAFYDFLKWTWSAAAGKTPHQPETPFVQRYAERQEPILGEMAAGLEGALHDLHRPISRESPMTISILRPRVGEIIRLDDHSLSYVTPNAESDVVEGVEGNVTKYNILSGFGRFYDDEEERTISFELEESVSSSQKRHLTWSMHQRSRDLPGKLLIDVRQVFTARGELKRYKIVRVRRSVMADPNE